MAKRNNQVQSTAPQAPVLVLGESLAAALAAASTPTPELQVPGAVASESVAIQPATVVVPVPAPVAVHPTQIVVGLGKPYNVRAGTQFDNVRSWQATVAFLQANGGQCTVGALANHLKGLYNHANFAGYAVRRGYLTPVQAATA